MADRFKYLLSPSDFSWSTNESTSFALDPSFMALLGPAGLLLKTNIISLLLETFKRLRELLILMDFQTLCLKLNRKFH